MQLWSGVSFNQEYSISNSVDSSHLHLQTLTGFICPPHSLTWCCGGSSHLSHSTYGPIDSNRCDSEGVHCFRDETGYSEIPLCCVESIIAGWRLKLYGVV